VAAGEVWCIWERAQTALAAEQKLARVRNDLAAVAATEPAPSREIALQIESDLARAQSALATMQAELRGRGPAAARLAATKAPVARTDAFFDLATFVERSRGTAQKQGVIVAPAAAHFGFSLYANEAPEAALIEPVFRQRLVAEYLVDALLAARPRALLAVQRERPLTADERKLRAEALAAADPSAPPAAAESAAQLSPDYFDLDARLSARAPGLVEVSAFRLIFTGQTAALRALLNQLAGFELPVIVRAVEVEPAAGEDLVAAGEEPPAATAPPGPPASIVLTAPAAKPAAKTPSAIAPIVARSVSKFTVTLEFVALTPPPAAAAASAP
jgi:hypothetical protein